MALVKLLSGHVSAETAYVVNDYPYGRKLRCKRRYWLEYKRGQGVRLVTQTTDPKRSSEGLDVWNAAKPETYADLGAALYLDEQGYVQCARLTGYCEGAEAATWRETYGAGVPAGEALEVLHLLVEGKRAYDRLRAEGMEPPEAKARARVEAIKAVKAIIAATTEVRS